MTILKALLLASLWTSSQHKLVNSKGFYTVFTTRVKVGDRIYSVSNPNVSQDVPGTEQLAKYGWHCKMAPVEWETDLGAMDTAYCTNDIDGILLATGARCATDSEDQDKSSIIIDQPDDPAVVPVSIVVSCSTRSIRKN